MTEELVKSSGLNKVHDGQAVQTIAFDTKGERIVTAIRRWYGSCLADHHRPQPTAARSGNGRTRYLPAYSRYAGVVRCLALVPLRPRPVNTAIVCLQKLLKENFYQFRFFNTYILICP